MAWILIKIAQCFAIFVDRLGAGDASERVYGLGQGNWTTAGGAGGGCDGRAQTQRIVPFIRNGQTVDLLQRKFHVSIPFAYSTAGYGFLFNMPGYGSVSVGARGDGGMAWRAEAALALDFWATALPAGVPATDAEPIYTQYADATGHAPPLREDAMLFWQSRNRYRSSAIALDVARRYQRLGLPVGVLVVDFHNMVHDGDFAPNPACYPSVANLTKGIRAAINASTVFSMWPEALPNSAEFATLLSAGCLMNPDLGGLGIDATLAHCRELIWDRFLKPRYVDQGVSAFWLDETDGEGSGGQGDGNHGYDTSHGPAVVASNLWVNSWISTFTDPVAALGEERPLALVRGVWAGGQRHGVVLWSSDVESTFGELAAQVPLGVHASLSGIPWWTSDVGGYGCGNPNADSSPYMQELIVRWYQFGAFCPVFRTHGCRHGSNPEPCPPPCAGPGIVQSCGANEVWSYGNATQALLSKYVRLRASLKPYVAALAANVTARGVPTMRPLWWEFPSDADAVGINDQYMLGAELLVAPVTAQGATSRSMYFPAGAKWRNFFNKDDVVDGGARRTVAAPLDTIPVYWRS